MQCPKCGHEYCNATYLTPVLSRVVDFIHDYMVTNKNRAPSFEEIRKAIKVANKSTVYKHINRLKDLGVLTYGHYQPRSISLL